MKSRNRLLDLNFMDPEILAALTNVGLPSCLDILEKQRNSKKFNFGDYYSSLSKRANSSLFLTLERLINYCLEEVENNADSNTNTWEEKHNQMCGLLSLAVDWVSTIVRMSDHNLDVDLVKIICVLHDRALLMLQSMPTLQEETAQLCFLCWQSDVVCKESVITQSVPYFILRALTTGKSLYVKRCNAMKSALLLFDFDDTTSIGDLQQLLYQAMFSPAFIRVPEGRRFLSSLFNIHPRLISELCSIIKNQLLSAKKSILNHYSEILFRAWRESKGLCLIELELFLQELVHLVICANSSALNTAARRLYMEFYEHKSFAGVDAMMLRLFEPLLFRGLSSSNSNIRLNSLHLLIDCFPLQDSNASNIDFENLFSKQMNCVMTALDDKFPSIRAAAALGICKFLDLFWELFPVSFISGVLKKITGRLVYDSTSANVRGIALQGLSLLIQNPISHTFLNKLLPNLGRLLWDPSDFVRSSFLDLLINVRRASSLSLTDIIQVEDLLDAFGLEKSIVTTKIRNLLWPTYFPNRNDGPAMIACLLRMRPKAGLALCKSSVSSREPLASLDDIICLAKDLNCHLLASKPVKSTKVTSLKRRTNDSRKHGLEDSESIETWTNILHGLHALVSGIANQDIDRLGDVFSSNNICLLYDICDSLESRSILIQMSTLYSKCNCKKPLEERCFQDFTKYINNINMGKEYCNYLKSALICVLSSKNDVLKDDFIKWLFLEEFDQLQKDQNKLILVKLMLRIIASEVDLQTIFMLHLEAATNWCCNCVNVIVDNILEGLELSEVTTCAKMLEYSKHLDFLPLVTCILSHMYLQSFVNSERLFVEEQLSNSVVYCLQKCQNLVLNLIRNCNNDKSAKSKTEKLIKRKKLCHEDTNSSKLDVINHILEAAVGVIGFVSDLALLSKSTDLQIVTLVEELAMNVVRCVLLDVDHSHSLEITLEIVLRTLNVCLLYKVSKLQLNLEMLAIVAANIHKTNLMHQTAFKKDLEFFVTSLFKDGYFCQTQRWMFYTSKLLGGYADSYAIGGKENDCKVLMNAGREVDTKIASGASKSKQSSSPFTRLDMGFINLILDVALREKVDTKLCKELATLANDALLKDFDVCYGAVKLIELALKKYTGIRVPSNLKNTFVDKLLDINRKLLDSEISIKLLNNSNAALRDLITVVVN